MAGKGPTCFGPDNLDSHGSRFAYDRAAPSRQGVLWHNLYISYIWFLPKVKFAPHSPPLLGLVMPRAESQAKHLGPQFYHSQFTGAQYLPDCNSSTSSPPLSPSSQHASTPSASASPGAAGKKKHVCGTCDRAFTTSGHLARHSRVHTGERNHKCPFPGCETRCSRQDNLQQQ